MRLVANKPVEYARVKYPKGARFDAADKDARVLIAAGLASQDLCELPAPAEVPVVTEITTRRRRGRYATRDMRANP